MKTKQRGGKCLKPLEKIMADGFGEFYRDCIARVPESCQPVELYAGAKSCQPLKKENTFYLAGLNTSKTATATSKIIPNKKRPRLRVA